MKKLSMLLLLSSSIVFIICLTGCGGANKAKKLAEQYLYEQYSYSPVEIVEFGELEDFIFEDDEEALRLAEASSIAMEYAHDAITMSGEARSVDLALAKRYMDSSKYYRIIADSLDALFKNVEIEEYQIKVVDLTVKSRNSEGQKETEQLTLFFNTELTKVGFNPKEVIEK